MYLNISTLFPLLKKKRGSCIPNLHLQTRKREWINDIKNNNIQNYAICEIKTCRSCQIIHAHKKMCFLRGEGQHLRFFDKPIAVLIQI